CAARALLHRRLVLQRDRGRVGDSAWDGAVANRAREGSTFATSDRNGSPAHASKMNTKQAKEILLLYRESIDDGDPQSRQALMHAQDDPDLAQWLREQTSCYNAIRSTLLEPEPPRNLSEGITCHRPIPVRRDWMQILKIAAA